MHGEWWNRVAAGVAAAMAVGGCSGSSPSGIGHEQTTLGDGTAAVTGGGTVLAAPTFPNTVASFGLNARGSTVGSATGRIDYNRHRKGAGNHVNVPVVLLEAESSSTTTPNGTGGKAALVGDCGDCDFCGSCGTTGAECPPGIQSVVVYV